MTSGYPSDATEDSVQADIAAASYATTSLTSGPALTVGSSISLRATAAGRTPRYMAHTGSTVHTQVVSSSSDDALKERASWAVRTGLGNSACFSFESKDTPGSYIRHDNFALVLEANGGTKQFYEDATFCPQAALNGQGNSIRSWSHPSRYFRSYNDVAYAASNGGVNAVDTAALFNDDVSWVVSTGFA